MLNGVGGGSATPGSTTEAWRFLGAAGRGTPTISPTRRAHAPAAFTRTGVERTPRLVSTRYAPSEGPLMPTTSECSQISTPRVRAASAKRRTVASGVAHGSSGEYVARTTPSAAR